MTMSEYLDASDSGMVRTGNDKEMYTATCSQNFRDAGVGLSHLYPPYLLGSRGASKLQHRAPHYFNMGSIRNVSISMTGYRYEYDNRPTKACTFR
ncbi:hypothetical protein ACLK17_14450 [Escherichia coli]